MGARTATTICPAGGDCDGDARCHTRCIRWIGPTPLEIMFPHLRPAVHFVGFRGEEYQSAVRIWGVPDFYHRVWDQRAQCEIAESDTVVFAYKADPEYVCPYTFDDSNQDGDPAARERAIRDKGDR